MFLQMSAVCFTFLILPYTTKGLIILCILAKSLRNEMRRTEYVENCSSRRAQGTVVLRWQSELDVHLRPTCPRTAANVLVITVAGAEL